MDYQDTFSNNLVPAAGLGYVSVVLTASQATNWPYNYTGDGLVTAAIMDVACEVGNVLSLPPVDQVSVGEAVIVRNVGANALKVHDSNAATLAVIAAGVAQLFWVKDNVYPGAWGQVTYGAGTAAVTAGALAGFGTKATGATLSVAAPVLATASSLSLTVGHRGQAIEFTGGAGTLSLDAASVYGNDFFCYVKNSGSGLITITPYAGGTIDGQSALDLQPSESLILLCTGSTDWFSVGYGRSILYQFSQLVLDVSAGGTFTLSSTQASNKMLTFIGNPAVAVYVVVPTTVSVYYVANNLSTAITVQVKTAGMPGSNVGQTQRAVLLCDGASVTAAQSVVVNSAVGILDGSEAAPSLNFSSKSNTGLYKYSTQGFGFSVNGVAQLYSNGGTAGVEVPFGITIGGVKLRTSATGSTVLAAGTTAQRDAAPAVGWTRFNTTLGYTETWVGTGWASSQLAGFRNKVINGGCQVAQRGEVPVFNNTWNYGGCDRILFGPSGFTTLTGTLVQVADIGASGQSAQGVGVTTTGTGNIVFQTRLEAKDVACLNGKTVTISANVSTSVSGNPSAYIALRAANSRDNFSGQSTLINGPSATTSGGVTKLSCTIALGDTDASNGLSIDIIWTPIGAVTGGVFLVWNIQLEEGSIATPFEQRPYGLELMLCQRYYETGVTYYNGGGAPGNFGFTNTFKVNKRATPTINASNSVVSNFTTVIGLQGVNASSFQIYHTLSAAAVGAFVDYWEASAEL